MNRRKIVNIDEKKKQLVESPGFKKKGLADYHLELLGLCEFGCAYCSSNNGNYLRINRGRFAQATLQQVGQRVLPTDDPNLMFVYRGILERVEAELKKKPKSFGEGQTLVVSMLTDGFSPWLVEQGVTRKALGLVLKYTSFRIRILTKNEVVGRSEWIAYFLRHPGRFVIGLSCGSNDDVRARKIEKNTSSPSARLRALRRLQDAGVPTYGMLCPIFPDMLRGEALVTLIDQIRPSACEDVWAEPYNSRDNWRQVRDAYEHGSDMHAWFNRAFDPTSVARDDVWSDYATRLYARLRSKAEREGWLQKLHYLLYEDRITEAGAPLLGDLAGVMLQSKAGGDGMSKNKHLRLIQS